ncbi:acyltransferase family protein [Frateuria aurantia]
MPRRHDIDALRVIAFGLLLLYHTAMLYVAPIDDWAFLLKSHHLAEWLQYPMLLLNRWRMELLFLISGVSLRFMLKGEHASALRVLWLRHQRLVLPLLFGMAMVVPCQAWLHALQDGRSHSGYWWYWSHAYFVHPPAQDGPTWAHLWYLAYLWCYTFSLLLMVWVIRSVAGPRRRSRPRLALRGSALLWVPALPLLTYGYWLQPRFPESHALMGDWYAHAMYLTLFLYGYLLGQPETTAWSELARLRWSALALAMCCFIPYLFLDKFAGHIHWHNAPTPLEQSIAWGSWLVLHYLYTWVAICALLGWGRHGLNRAFTWLPYAREAVYPWYVLHQSVLLIVAHRLLPLAMGPVLEPALILAGTVASCAVINEFGIRRWSWIRPWFGLPAQARPGIRTIPRSATLEGAISSGPQA